VRATFRRGRLRSRSFPHGAIRACANRARRWDQSAIGSWAIVEAAGGVRWVSDLEGAGAAKTMALRTVCGELPVDEGGEFDLPWVTLREAGASVASRLLAAVVGWRVGPHRRHAEDQCSQVVSAYGDASASAGVLVVRGCFGVSCPRRSGQDGLLPCGPTSLSSESGPSRDAVRHPSKEDAFSRSVRRRDRLQVTRPASRRSPITRHGLRRDGLRRSTGAYPAT